MKNVALLSLLLVGALLSGCATAKSSDQKEAPKAALACPECKTVTLGPVPSVGAWRGEPPTTITKHECRGCRDDISLRPDGLQLQHQCSICQQSPFSCEMTHAPTP